MGAMGNSLKTADDDHRYLNVDIDKRVARDVQHWKPDSWGHNESNSYRRARREQQITKNEHHEDSYIYIRLGSVVPVEYRSLLPRPVLSRPMSVYIADDKDEETKEFDENNNAPKPKTHRYEKAKNRRQRSTPEKHEDNQRKKVTVLFLLLVVLFIQNSCCLWLSYLRHVSDT